MGSSKSKASKASAGLVDDFDFGPSATEFSYQGPYREGNVFIKTPNNSNTNSPGQKSESDEDEAFCQFDLDNVQPEPIVDGTRAPLSEVRGRFVANNKHNIEASSIPKQNDPDSKFIYKNTSKHLHGFVAACFDSFANHFPLVISPDHIFQVVLEQWSRHVALHSKELENKIMGKEPSSNNNSNKDPIQKKVIKIRVDHFVKGSDNNDWSSLFDDFCKEIKNESNPSLYECVTSEPFSTTDKVSMVCRNISLMAGTKAFFDFKMYTLCGIPYIRLLGVKEDWIKLKIKIKNLGEFMTEPFRNKWIPILEDLLDKFIQTWENKIDRFFWSSIVKYHSTHGSGRDTYITGWINCLFPYLSEDKENILCLKWDRLDSFVKEQGGPRAIRNSSIQDFESFFCTAPVEWNYLGSIIHLDFKCGFAHPIQHLKSKEVRPLLSWAVVQTSNQ